MNMLKEAEKLLYPPLEHHDSFRLLHVSRCPTGDEWTGTLVEARLGSDQRNANTTKYIALSYVWGDATFNVPNENAIEVSLSLSTALGHILSYTTEASTLNIWTDQFCINQRDDTEKIQQVKLMSRIFAGAEQVIGWLGPGFEGSDEALDDILIFGGPDKSRDESSDEEYRRAVHSRFGVELSREAIMPHLTNGGLLATDPRSRLRRLFNLQWFHRRWIAQEACLASKLRVWCGRRSISGEQMFRAIGVIQESIIRSLDGPRLHKPFRNAYALLNTREEVQTALKDGRHISLANIAANLSFLECKEDEDRINALLGTAQPSITWFTPKYGCAPDLYIDFALSHMQHFRSFEILHFAGVTEPSRHVFKKEGEKLGVRLAGPAKDLPSWVPDWRIRRRQLPMVSVESDDLVEDSSQFEVPFDPSHKTLTLKGKLLEASIEPCGYSHLDRFQPKEHPDYQLSVDAWCNNIFGNYLCKLDSSAAKEYLKYPTFTHWFTSLVGAGKDPSAWLLPFARTLIMDGRAKSNERPNCIVPRDGILEYFLEYAKLHLVQDSNAAGAAHVAISKNESHMEKAAAYGYLSEHICRYRTLFVTNDGLLGLGSPGIRPGDSVCFFPGLKTPFVVHRKGNHFALQGECYIDGLMDVSYDELDAVEMEIMLE